MKNIIYECETADPDDIMAILFLLSHPESNLVGINITPGSNLQVGLIRAVLKKLNKEDILIGVRKLNYEKDCVSEFHNKILEFSPANPDGLGSETTNELYKKYPDAIYIVGSAPYNLKAAIELNQELKIPFWLQQGGYVSDILTINPLEKFKGKKECVSANVGDTKLIRFLLSSPQISKKLFVSKNVCHGVYYDRKLHEELGKIKRNKAMEIMYKSMDIYLDRRGDGKIFHDPLACSVALNESVCQFMEAELYHTKDGWGANPRYGSDVSISIGVDKEKFKNILFRQRDI